MTRREEGLNTSPDTYEHEERGRTGQAIVPCTCEDGGDHRVGMIGHKMEHITQW